jgi:hypothetical protein
MDRDEFIKLMISELSKQKEENASTFENPAIKTPDEIFNKLCFDYPLVNFDEMNTLAAAIIEITNNNVSPSCPKLGSVLYFNPKFLDNLITMNIESYEKKSDVSDLGAVVFISYLNHMLNQGHSKLSSLFRESLKPNVLDSYSETVSWESILTRFNDFIFMLNPSVLNGVSQEIFLKHDFFSTLTSIISTLNPYIQLPHVKKDSLSGKLRCFLDSEQKNDPQFSDETSILLKNIWVHLVLVAKDILMIYPSTISVYLTKFLDSIISDKILESFRTDSHFHVFSPKSYPESHECLSILVLTHISTNEMSKISDLKSLSSTNHTASKIENECCLFITSYISKNSSFIVSTIERMMKYSISDGEGLKFLCDLCEICCFTDYFNDKINSTRLTKGYTFLIHF